MKLESRLFIGLFWLFIFIILLCQLLAINDYSFKQSIIYSAVITGTFTLFFSLISNLWIRKHIKFRKINYFIGSILIFSILASVILTVEDYLLNSIFFRNWLFEPKKSFPQFFGMWMAAILISGVAYAFQLYQHHIQVLKSTQILKDQLNELEMKSIRQQLSPHFTFNILNNIQFLIQRNKEEALNLLSQYSKILRYYVYESQQKTISLDDEIIFLKTYTELEKERIDENAKLQTYFDIEPNNYKIAPFILSTFVENSFKHLSKKNKEILIEIRLKDACLSLHIKNTFDEPEQQMNKKDGVGLQLVQKRLDLIYNNQFSLEIKNDNNIFEVQLSLNLNIDEKN